jgi:hypothetical protein
LQGSEPVHVAADECVANSKRLNRKAKSKDWASAERGRGFNIAESSDFWVVERTGFRMCSFYVLVKSQIQNQEHRKIRLLRVLLK